MTEDQEDRLLSLLEDVIEQRDKEILELKLKLREMEEKFRSTSWGWAQHSSLPVEQVHPVPRLEIELWERKDEEGLAVARGWNYRLVYRHYNGGVLSVPLGVTTVQGHDTWPARDLEGKLLLPLRDGMHIRYDAKQLNLPAYAVWGFEYDLLEEL